MSEFEQRVHTSSKPAAQQVTQPAPQAPPVATARHLRKLANFSGIDMKNRQVTLNDTNAKLILVCFWSPRDANSSRELIVISRLFEQFRRQGLEAVGISLDRQYEEIAGAIEDFGTAFPIILDRYGIADREGIQANSVPFTFVLNRQHEVVASGLHKQALEATVKRLMQEP